MEIVENRSSRRFDSSVFDIYSLTLFRFQPLIAAYGEARGQRKGHHPKSYINLRKSRVMPTCSINERTDFSQQTIHFEPSNIRASFKTWYYHELRKQEHSRDEISVDNITDWQKVRSCSGKP